MICVSKAAVRFASSTSRWKARQGSDPFARDAKLKGLKSRAAYKLLEVSRCSSSLFPPLSPPTLIPLHCNWHVSARQLRMGLTDRPAQMDAKYRLFKKGQIVVDLACILSPRVTRSYETL